MKWVHKFLYRFKFYRAWVEQTKGIVLPGFRSLSVYTVAEFFFNDVHQETLVNKASSLAYTFLLAIFPGIIFIFTLIPYIPIKHFQEQLLEILALILPNNAYKAFQSTIEDIVKHQNVKLLSFGFFSALYFSTNGINKLMRAFNKAALVTESRSWLKRRVIALILTVIIVLSLLAAIAIMVIGQSITNTIRMDLGSRSIFWVYLIMFSRWLIVVVLFFFTVSILYRYGPAHRRRWKFLSAGSILATFLAVLTSLGFAFYINHFSRFNKIYGSIGTLIVIMIWLYLNSLIVLIGFELNASIDLSKRRANRPPQRKANRLKIQKGQLY